MKIRTKTLSVIALAVLVSAIANFLVLKAVVFPSFIELEQASAEKDMQRLTEAVKLATENISAMAKDYAVWDDTYYFALNGTEGYVETNFTATALENLKIKLAGIYHLNGDPVVEYIVNTDTGSLEAAGELSLSKNASALRLFSFPDENHGVTGLLLTEKGPLMVASQPILKTTGEGPIAGAFIFARFLDEDAIASLQQQTRIDFRVDVLGERPLEAEDQRHLERLAQSGDDILAHESADATLHAHALVRDINGRPALLLSADISRDISNTGMNVLLASVVGLGLAGLMVLAVTGVLLQWILVGPVAKLTGHVLAIGQSGDISRRVALDRSDELGLLSKEFDAMLEKLADARNRLLEHSYRSGLAEMASGVLHNIRNQLAPLTMRLGRLREQVAAPRDTKIERALDELTLASAEAERKEKMAKYIKMSMQAIDERQQKLSEQLSGLSDDFARFEQVLRELDKFSRTGDELESTSLADVVRETITMLPQFPDLQVIIRVDPKLAVQPPVLGKSFLLKHVIHNLVINAVESITASGRRAGEIRIDVAQRTLDGRAIIDLAIADDGSGIAPETLEKIFARGFSTKKGERRGTGLHWCANCITAMGGRITASSEGLGKGATFRLALPVADAAASQAAA